MNRRELLALSAATVCLPDFLSAVEPKTFENLVRSKLTNGIDKIFKVDSLENLNKTWNCFNKNGDSILPIFPNTVLSDINNICWRTLIAASFRETKYPKIEASLFLCLHATDIFVDNKLLKWALYERSRNHQEDVEFPYKIHGVNLNQYLPFYTDSMKQKIRSYNSSIFIACNLKKDTAFIPVKDNVFGCCILEPKNFCIGQI